MVTPALPMVSGSLPTPRTRLIGREEERAAARAFLFEEAVPLLTLTGSGGVGTTRLALARVAFGAVAAGAWEMADTGGFHVARETPPVYPTVSSATYGR